MENQEYRPPMSADTFQADALSSILSNPETMAKIRAMAEQLSSNGAPSATNSAIAPAPIGENSADGLASVLSNPALMAKLPQMMSLLAPMLASPPSPPHNETHKSTEDHRNDLLLALKPFLSPERCQAVDTILRIARLGTILRQIK